MPKLRDIKDPVDFIRFRFDEFLKYMGRSEYEQAYVTLATETLELLHV